LSEPKTCLAMRNGPMLAINCYPVPVFLWCRSLGNWLYNERKEPVMAITSVDLDREPPERARALTVER